MIYLDNAATTPVNPQVAQVISDSLHNSFANPSSLYSAGATSEIEMTKPAHLLPAVSVQNRVSFTLHPAPAKAITSQFTVWHWQEKTGVKKSSLQVTNILQCASLMPIWLKWALKQYLLTRTKTALLMKMLL